MLSSQYLLPMHTELVVDLFAGGGGASTGIEQAIGRHVDIAINHSADAIGMHEVNHPQTRHYCADVFEIDPRMATMGQPVGLLHASPDCTHFSQAKGGQPRSKEIRSLAWVVIRWAGTVRPDVITLENVEQMLQWSPLVAKRCSSTGRVVTLDEVTDTTGKAAYRMAAPGEVVPRSNQFLVPSKKQLGRNWGHFVQALRDLGYAVQWRVICNADLGAHSTRTRLYMIARCDGAYYTGTNTVFSDTYGHWAAGYIDRAYELGWINGYGTTYAPDRYISRAETVAVLNRVLNRAPQYTSDLTRNYTTFSDVATSAWYYLDVEEAANSHTYTRKSNGEYETWNKLIADPSWF